MEISPARWMLPDRAGFAEWVSHTFAYGRDRDDASSLRGENALGSMTLFPQQRFVRDFMQAASPYAGLVLYHGLGVGKSCAAVAALAALESVYRAVVLLPASLRPNFVNEIRKCGSSVFAEHGRWTRSAEGAWVRAAAGDDDGTPFARLAPAEKQQIRTQLDRVIADRVTFINYNGLTRKKVNDIVNAPSNPFSGTAVVVDEVHKFISQVTKGGLVAQLYERIMDATPRKAILLTGTPFMNSVVELPYLINLAHGFLRVVEMRVAAPPQQTSSTEPRVRGVLEDHPFVNRFCTTYGDAGELLVSAQLTPPGFWYAPVAGREDGSVATTRPYVAAAPPPFDVTPDWVDRVRQRLVNDVSRVARVVRAPVRNALLVPVGDEFLAKYTAAQGARLKNVDALARRVTGTVSFYGVYDRAVYPSLREMRVVECPMSARQFDEYKDVRAAERRLEDAAVKFAHTREDDQALGAYKPRSRAVGNFVFPVEIPRPQRKDVAAVVAAEDVDRAYDEELARALTLLRRERPEALRHDGALRAHSPKFHALLAHLAEARERLALVYSEFRTMEGIGLLSACLDENGFSRVFVVRSPVTHEYRIAETAPDARDRYMVFDNSDSEAAQITLSAFNSEFDKLPAAAADDVRRITHSPELENRHGELARLLLITESGSEGINTKNVREVHALEPFWNSNRINQVVGRAVRAHSHANLPPDERSVEVFLYMSVLTPEQAQEQTIKKRDGGLTSDQHVFRVTQRKDALVSQMLRLLQRSAVDCRLHESAHRSIDPQHACIVRPANVAPDAFTYAFAPDAEGDDDGTAETKRLVAVRNKQTGAMFFMDPSTRRVYDYEALRTHNKLVTATP